MSLHVKFSALRNQLNAALVERDAEVHCMLLGLVAQEHLLLVGPPGTGKTWLCSNLVRAIDGAESFETLLTKFTTPEEICGPISVQGLKNDEYRRLTTGYLPTAHVGLIDEVWKASSAILNTFLTLMNERMFDNGGIRTSTPLKMLVAASNEWPVGDGFADLGAVFDRFLIRTTVRPVSIAGRDKLIFGDFPKVTPCVHVNDLDNATNEAAALPFSTEARESYHTILESLHGAGIDPGDRRCRKATKIARAEAWLNGNAEVQVADLECLQYVLWDDPQEQPAKASEVICKIANPVGAEINELLAQAEELITSISPDNLHDAETTAAVKKLKSVEGKLDKLAKSGGGNARAKRAFDYVNEKAISIQKRILGISA